MNLVLWLLNQLLSYSPFTWAAWIATAYGCARYGGRAGVFAGHWIIAGIAFVLDVNWVLDAMKMPAWDGAPDLDMVFYIGWGIRVLLINTVLLVVTWWASRLRRHSIEDKGRIA